MYLSTKTLKYRQSMTPSLILLKPWFGKYGFLVVPRVDILQENVSKNLVNLSVFVKNLSLFQWWEGQKTTCHTFGIPIFDK